MNTNKNIYFSQKHLVKSNVVCNFADAKKSLLQACTYHSRHRASLFRGVISFDGDFLAELRKRLASFIVTIANLSDLCQEILKARKRGIIVPALPLLTSSTSRTRKLPYVSNHSLWTSLKSSPRCFVSFFAA